jgi:hypothetical protein
MSKTVVLHADESNCGTSVWWFMKLMDDVMNELVEDE